MSSSSSILKELVLRAESKLILLEEKDVSKKTNNDSWSKKEILGHLVDSASNNHQRFVRAQLKDDLMFDGYNQDKWVKLQNYQSTPFKKIVDFWVAYNLHLSSVIENIEPDVLSKLRQNHNLDKIAFNTVPKDQSVSLEYFVNDYIVHLKHHLNQILPVEF